MSILPLALEDATVAEGSRLLAGPFTYTFTAGRPHLVIGPNGAGKTLLLRLAHGLVRPASGRVAWLGPDAGSARERQAFVFQKTVVLRRSVLANVAYPLRLRGLGRREAQARAAAALRLAGIAGLAERSATVLSAGERQKLGLARALVSEPDVVFLDEPAANLDPAATRDIEALVEGIARAGVTVVMTSHDIGQVRRLADGIVFLHRGRVLEAGPAALHLAAPRTPQLAAYLRGDLVL
jgi:tungstate transport system ATP-binding protein